MTLDEAIASLTGRFAHVHPFDEPKDRSWALSPAMWPAGQLSAHVSYQVIKYISEISAQDAIDNWSKVAIEWAGPCKDHLYWRHEPELESETDFETKQTKWQVYARAAAL